MTGQSLKMFKILTNHVLTDVKNARGDLELCKFILNNARLKYYEVCIEEWIQDLIELETKIETFPGDGFPIEKKEVKQCPEQQD